MAICLAGHAYLGFALGLSVDEAHYALYAAHPALSYFDHPPLVGWVQIPFVGMGGADWMLRLAPLALWFITAWALWRWSRKLSLWALALFLLSPIHQLLGLALVPDSLLLPLTLWVMALTWSLSAAPGALRLWLWLGVALGLAGLSKYTAVLLAMSAGAVLLSVHGLALLKQRGLWLTALVALTMISPVLVWNAQHDWVSFTYQLNHASGNQSWSLANVLRFDGVQLVGYGTLPLMGLVVFLWKLQAQPPTENKRLMWLCLAFGLPTLVLAAYSSGKGAALPHWTATGWLALLPLSALGLQHLWHTSKGKGTARTAARGLICALAMLQAVSIAALGLMMATGGQWRGAPLFGERGNPFADLHDWQAASQKAVQLQTHHQADALAVSNWTLASRLAWYARPARVLALDGKNKQFEMWHGKLKAGDSAIWVNWSQMPFDAPTSQVARSLFENCTSLPTAHVLVAPMAIGEMSRSDKGVVSDAGHALVQPAIPLSAHADISPTSVGATHTAPPLATSASVSASVPAFTYYLCRNWQGTP